MIQNIIPQVGLQPESPRRCGQARRRPVSAPRPGRPLACSSPAPPRCPAPWAW